METRKITGGREFRSMGFAGAGKDIEESRTLELSFSSETDKVERYFGVEILDHARESVRMGRLESGAPLLWGHDQDAQIGVVESARIEDGRGVASVRFSRSRKGEGIWKRACACTGRWATTLGWPMCCTNSIITPVPLARPNAPGDCLPIAWRSGARWVSHCG